MQPTKKQVIVRLKNCIRSVRIFCNYCGKNCVLDKRHSSARIALCVTDKVSRWDELPLSLLAPSLEHNGSFAVTAGEKFPFIYVRLHN